MPLVLQIALGWLIASLLLAALVAALCVGGHRGEAELEGQVAD